MSSCLQPHDFYLRQMIEFKQRLRAVDWILGAKKPLTCNEEVYIENAFLQVRKII